MLNLKLTLALVQLIRILRSITLLPKNLSSHCAKHLDETIKSRAKMTRSAYSAREYPRRDINHPIRGGNDTPRQLGSALRMHLQRYLPQLQPHT